MIPHAPDPQNLAADTADLLNSARSGNRGALNALIERHYEPVRHLVHRTLGSSLRRRKPWLSSIFSTGDVVQEVFRAVIKSLDGFDGTTDQAFQAYLTTLVKHRLVDSIRFHEAERRDRRRQKGLDPTFDPPQESSGQVTHLSRVEALQAFDRALGRFRGREQVLLRERIENRTPFSQLAAQLDYPSADAARKAFYLVQARLIGQLRS